MPQVKFCIQCGKILTRIKRSEDSWDNSKWKCKSCKLKYEEARFEQGCGQPYFNYTINIIEKKKDKIEEETEVFIMPKWLREMK